MQVYVLEKTVFSESYGEMVYVIDVYESKEDVIDYLKSIGFHLNVDKCGYENSGKPEDYYRIIKRELIEKGDMIWN